MSFDVHGSPAVSTALKSDVTNHPVALNPRAWPDPARISLESAQDEQDEVIINAARACMEAKEFQRAAWVLQGSVGQKAAFLGYYAQYLVRGS
jgi:hypothetical protein